MTQKVLRKEILVKASIEELWRLWTTVSGIKTFFAPEAGIQLKPGGAYEMYFMPEEAAGNRGGEGCTVIELMPPHCLVFTWNFPPNIPTLRGTAFTQVRVTFSSVSGGAIMVLLEQSGWKSGEDWDQGYAYFDRAWGIVLARLAHSLAHGPIDWGNPFTPM